MDSTSKNLKRSGHSKSNLLSASTSTVLNVMMVIFICAFISCTVRFMHRMSTSVDVAKTNKQISHSEMPSIKTRKSGYYDFEAYKNITEVLSSRKNRNYYYIDLGCFDGRDMDMFLHFRYSTMQKHGRYTLVAFEPDPINFSACRTALRNYNGYKYSIHQSAASTEDGQVGYIVDQGKKSKIDRKASTTVNSTDISKWLIDMMTLKDYVYMKFTIEGAEIDILEKMVSDRSLALVDYLEIEWSDHLSPSFEPRRISLECMFDNFGMDFLYMINPDDMKSAFNSKQRFSNVKKDKGWRLSDPSVRFHYRTRKEVSELYAERLQHKTEN